VKAGTVAEVQAEGSRARNGAESLGVTSPGHKGVTSYPTPPWGRSKGGGLRRTLSVLSWFANNFLVGGGQQDLARMVWESGHVHPTAAVAA